MSKRILITGAAGVIGRATLAALADHADRPEIVAFDRDTPAARRALKPFAGRARIVCGDIAEAPTLAPACEGIDAALHLAAILPPNADENPARADRVNRGGTAALVAALEAQSPGAFLVYASSVAVYGDRLDNPGIRVGDPLAPSPGDHYAETKIAAEKIVTQSRLDWSIFRLSAVMGEHGMSPLMFHMPLDTVMELVTVQDTARALAAAPFASAELNGRVFNLGGGADCRISYRDFLARSFELAGLGSFDLPEAAFATCNFHCGAYIDGDELEDILHFRRDGLEAYFERWAKSLPGWQRFAARLLRRPIKARLLSGSEPLKALKTGDRDACRRFFGETRPPLPS